MNDCEVLPFPGARRIGKARLVAARLLERRGSPAMFDFYWRKTATAMARQMIDAGVLERAAWGEVDAFARSVRREMDALQADANLDSVGESA